VQRDVPGLLQHGITALVLKTEPGAAGSLIALADRIELWPIDRLRPYERNPRTHSDAQVDKIAASMIEFGWTNPVLVDEQGGILAGHGRLLAARKLGLGEVPVIRFEHLSEAQKRAYLIADNALALQSGWSEELLAQELAWLRNESFDLDLIGFDATELERLLELADEERAAPHHEARGLGRAGDPQLEQDARHRARPIRRLRLDPDRMRKDRSPCASD
jgi:ParB-like chromosome segregation protein Spo0J